MNEMQRPPDSANLFERLEQLNQVGVALSKETDINRLLEAILLAAKKITNADGGTLYRVMDERNLKFEIMRNDTLNIAMGGTTGVDIPFPPISLFDPDGKPVNTMVATYVFHHDISVNIADAYIEKGFDFSGTKNFDKKTGYRSQSFLTVPMKNHENEIIGVLQLLNAKDRASGAGQPVLRRKTSSWPNRWPRRRRSALTNRLLINHLENLFESFIQPHQRGDRRQVAVPPPGIASAMPQLTMMLAEAVNNCGVGPLKNFNMNDKDRYELKIAGLLHDCGKVTTPVHVVDKATKLQTIFDRIHLVDTRFEVLKRDAEITLLKAQAGSAGKTQ